MLELKMEKRKKKGGARSGGSIVVGAQSGDLCEFLYFCVGPDRGRACPIKGL